MWPSETTSAAKFGTKYIIDLIMLSTHKKKEKKEEEIAHRVQNSIVI